MKKTILASFVLVGLVIFSCKKDKITEKTNIASQDNLTNPYDYIGELHNQGLTELKNKCVETNGNVDMGAFGKEFMLNNIQLKYDHINTDKLDNTLTNFMSFHSENDNFYLSRNKSLSDSIENVIDTAQFTDYQKDKLNEIVDVFDSKIDITSKLKTIEYEVLTSKVSDFEKSIILSAISISKYSYAFWTVNENLGNRNKATKPKAPNLAKSDLGGAITGGAYSVASGASTTGLIFGPGGYILTTAGAAVTGALYSSGLTLISWGFF